jgi:hypothetical protein
MAQVVLLDHQAYQVLMVHQEQVALMVQTEVQVQVE